MANSSVPGRDTPLGTGHRRVYRSAPGAPSPADWSAGFGQLARKVYTGLRDGGLDPEAAVWWCNGGGSGHVIAPVGHWIGCAVVKGRAAG